MTMTVDYEKEYKDFCDREKNLAHLVLSRSEKYGEKVALKHKPYKEWESYTWKEFGENVRAAGKGLIELGVKKGDMVGIFAGNRAEWSLADVGILAINSVDVPIYSTNSAAEAEYIVDNAELGIVFVGDQTQYDRIMSFFKDSKFLKKVIAFDKTIKIQGEESMLFDDFLKIGKESGKDKEFDERYNNICIDDPVSYTHLRAHET